MSQGRKEDTHGTGGATLQLGQPPTDCHGGAVAAQRTRVAAGVSTSPVRGRQVEGPRPDSVHGRGAPVAGGRGAGHGTEGDACGGDHREAGNDSAVAAEAGAEGMGLLAASPTRLRPPAHAGGHRGAGMSHGTREHVGLHARPRGVGKTGDQDLEELHRGHPPAQQPPAVTRA